MNPKTKKALIIAGVAIDISITIALFVMSIILLVNVPKEGQFNQAMDPTSFCGWFLTKPYRILLIVVLPLIILLALNVFITYRYFKETGEKKKVTLADLSDEEKEALRKKILEEMASGKETK